MRAQNALEHASVTTTRRMGYWPAGTAGTVVSTDPLIVEIVGPEGETLDLLYPSPDDIAGAC